MQILRTDITFVFHISKDGTAEAERIAPLVPGASTSGLDHQKVKVRSEGCVTTEQALAMVEPHHPRLLRAISIDYRLATGDDATPTA